jgi:N-sulfoglucosamine sulfohydrolase
MVSWTDIAPTLLDAAGVQPPYPLHGRSVLPVLEQPSPSGWDQVFFSHTFHELTMYYPSRGTRTRQFKYIRNLYPELEYPHASDLLASPTWQSVRSDPSNKLGQRTVKDYLHRSAEELYDVSADPLEVRNLASSPQHQATLVQLREQTREFRVRTNDPWVTPPH